MKDYDFIENIGKYVGAIKAKREKKRKINNLEGKWSANDINNFIHSLTLPFKVWSSSITCELVQNANLQAPTQAS